MSGILAKSKGRGSGILGATGVEGTTVESTGEAGGEKFLREDGDNTSSWQTAIPSGMVAPFTMASAPTGWLICNDAAISRTTYSALFTAIGTTWGVGDGSTTFNVPDLRGAFLRGTGSHGTSNMADGNDFAGPAVAAYEDDMSQGHWHQVYRGGGAMGNGAGGMGVYPSGQGSLVGTGYYYDAGNPQAVVAKNVLTDGTYGTPRIGDETRPFNAGVNYCIKY